MPSESLSFISGVNFYCDHRCWRCPLTERCQVFARVARNPPLPAKGGPAVRVAAIVLESARVMIENTADLLREAPIDAIKTCIPGAAELEAAERRWEADLERDELVSRGKEYAHGTLRVLRALRPRLTRLEDAEAIDACDRLEETCLTVASKVFRAVSSHLSDPEGSRDAQADANGSAKVALLLIDESRRAWQLLGAPGRSAGNGAPRRFVVVLETLEAGLIERFPSAFSFIRPGFDTGDADPATTQMARAMLAMRPGKA